ncbi:MAG: TIGR02757 family protein [Bacteroidota bacterium]|nr:TIGR02757 family protein [Bacteroidota bacterium]
MKKQLPNPLADFLNDKVALYNQPSFIPNDPVCIPHMFTKKQDIEIAGIFAAVFAWGNRTTIIQKSKELMQLMDLAPHAFCLHHTDRDLQKLLLFKHRTFNATDLLYFIEFLHHHYSRYPSLENAFILPKRKQEVEQPTKTEEGSDPLQVPMAKALIHFQQYFFSLSSAPPRTRKHIASPANGSTCKRLNMYLRWMVRKDKNGVDFGIWRKLLPQDLICPIDLHVARVSKRFGLLQRKQIDWQAAVELTAYLKTLDPSDPVKYDFALFGLGVMEKYT